ncbi:MAG: protein BatD [Methylococcaceae bacterium]|nr:protein BatD [Methylococcaceae bacterium]
MSVWFGRTPEVFAAEITVTTDRNPVSIDESFRIIFSASDSPDDDPDFSPLEQDFDILSQSSNSNSSWINGKTTRTIQWTVMVMAKQAGNLTIPSIKFGKDTSQSTYIQVTQDAANKNVNADEDIFLDVEAVPQTPYVQSQILYTLRLYTRIDIAQARINEPELSDAVIEKLGEDSSFNTQVNGVSYTVSERKYAIFPQKSGSMTIKPLTLTAEVLASGRPSFNGFFSPQMTKTKRVESKAITLNVKPVPAEFTGKHWLSAEKLHLKQEWSGDIQQMKVGEPLTRTLTLLAQGTTVGKLPELNTAKTDDQLKAYPDQPVLQEQKKSEGIIAFREEKIALIPSKSGDYTLPAIEIPWFNTKTQSMEIAKIPETTITAASVPGTSTITPAPQSKNEVAAAAATALHNAPQVSINIWLWVSIGMAFGWLTTLIYFLTKRPARTPVKPDSRDDGQQIKLKVVVAQLKKACSDNNALTAKDSLIAWGRQTFNVSNLGAVADCCDARLRDEIIQLNQALYGKDAVEWQGKKLFQAFTENKARQSVVPSKENGLEPLYRL